MRVLERIGLDRPELRAWALYDWANSAFVTSARTKPPNGQPGYEAVPQAHVESRRAIWLRSIGSSFSTICQTILRLTLK